MRLAVQALECLLSHVLGLARIAQDVPGETDDGGQVASDKLRPAARVTAGDLAQKIVVKSGPGGPGGRCRSRRVAGPGKGCGLIMTHLPAPGISARRHPGPLPHPWRRHR